jgi:hypothetical protein
VRRTVATLLVVASPVLMAVPVGAREGNIPMAEVTPAAPAVVPAPPVALAPPAVPAPASATATARAATRPAVKAVGARTSAAAADDAAYAAQLQADLCQARAIFCGLDRGGRYPAG